jgi:hypothetical protein
MRKITTLLAVGLGLGLSGGPVLAQPRPGPAQPRLGIVIEGGVEFGGDDVATIGFNDGSEQDITAGEGLTFGGGVFVRPDVSSPFELRGTVGYKFTRTQDSDADIEMKRTVWEVVATYALDSQFWVGGGVSHHSAIKFDADGFGPDLEFDDATGFTLEIGWAWLVLSYTGIEYTDEGGTDYDASNFGVNLIGRF